MAYTINVASSSYYMPVTPVVGLSTSTSNITYTTMSGGSASTFPPQLEFISKYIIPAGATVYVASDIRSIDTINDILTLKKINHLFDGTYIIMSVSSECVFDLNDVVKNTSLERFRPPRYNPQNLAKFQTFTLKNMMLTFRLPKSYLGITHISTFEYSEMRLEPT